MVFTMWMYAIFFLAMLLLLYIKTFPSEIKRKYISSNVDCEWYPNNALMVANIGFRNMCFIILCTFVHKNLIGKIYFELYSLGQKEDT